jgi:hypothetical protein
MDEIQQECHARIAVAKEGLFEEFIFDSGRVGDGSQCYGDGRSTSGCGSDAESGSGSGTAASGPIAVEQPGSDDEG